MDVGEFLGSVAEGLSGFVGDVVGVIAGAIGAAISWGAGLLAEVLGVLPLAGDLGLAVPSGWVHGFAWIDSIVPLHEALVFFGILVGLRAAITLWHLTVSVYHLVPKPFMGT